jgi:hypothetical protein
VALAEYRLNRARQATEHGIFRSERCWDNRVSLLRKRYDTNGLRFQKLSSDLLRAALGLGARDLKTTAAGEHGATIEMPNVIFVDRKVLP